MDNRVYIEIAPGDVNYVNRIMEGYEYLGILTTIDPRRATCRINATADTRKRSRRDSHPSGYGSENPGGQRRSGSGIEVNISFGI